MKTTKLLCYCFLICSVHITISAQENEAQNTLIVGYVKDTKNKPLRNVAVFLDSTKTTVKTDKKGYYEIVPTKKVNSITVFSKRHGLLGIPYSGQKKVDFIFPIGNEVVKKRELAQLGFKGLRGQRKNELNYGDNNQSNASFSSIYELLEARIPGVKVSGTSISIRGAGNASFSSGSREPLLIVNDTPVQSIDNIAPQDVYSIKVLKDNEASFYGARGAYGVVKITLK